MTTSDRIIDAEMQLQENRDLAKRSFTGSFIYTIIWLSITLPKQFYATAPQIWWSLTLIFVALAVVRMILIENFEKIYTKSTLLWKSIFYPQILISSLLWGVLCAVAQVIPTFEELSFVILICTAGLTSGGSASIALHRPLSFGLITAYLLPTVVVMPFVQHIYKTEFLIIFIIYWLGMYSVTKELHKAYWLNLENSLIIKKYAEKLEHLNTIDGLTGLKNRAFFDETLRLEIKKSSRTQSPLTLLLLDIDRFKTINDDYGHLIGDECLRQLSTLLRSEFRRESNTVARFGGEEFAILLLDTNTETSARLAEKFRKKLENLQIKTLYGELPMTASIGISNVRVDKNTINEDIIDSADKALYKAKNSGRNRVETGD